jgi:hypothetical protein
MTTDVELFLNWRTVPSGIAWGDEVERTSPHPDILRVSAMPSFHFAPCDAGAGGAVPSPPPVDIPPGLLASLIEWPDLLTHLHFEVQVAQLATVINGIPENYVTNNAFDVLPVPTPTPAAVALGGAILKHTLDRRIVTRTPADGNCGQILRGRHAIRARRVRGYDDMPHLNRPGASLYDARFDRADRTLKALTDQVAKTAAHAGALVVGAPRMSREESASLFAKYRIFFPANIAFADRDESKKVDRFWRKENTSVVSRCERDLGRLAGNDQSDYRERLYAQAIFGVSLLSINPVPRTVHASIPAGQGDFGIEEALEALAAHTYPNLTVAVVGSVFHVSPSYLNRALTLWADLAKADPSASSSAGRAYLNLLRYHIANHHEDVACESPSHGGTPVDDCDDIDNLLAGLASWPNIARLTALCIEFEVGRNALMAASSGAGAGPYALRIRVKDIPRPHGYPVTLPEVSCWTAFTWDAAGGAAYDFWPAPRPNRGELVAGTLCLPGNYQLRNVDLDGDTHYSTRYKRDLDISEGDGATSKNLDVLEKGDVDCGLAMVATGPMDEAANSLNDENDQGTSLSNHQGVLLYADDLVVGYRIDVKAAQSASRWLSICERRVEYRLQVSGYPVNTPELEPSPLEVARVEGMVRKTARTSTGDQDKDEVTPHPTLFQWHDQNIAVRDTIEAPVDSSGGDDAQGTCQFAFSTSSRVPEHSQPSLRTDVGYFVGARATLANGSSLGRASAAAVYDGTLPATAATRLGDRGGATDSFLMSRVEPIQPPAAHLAEPIEGSRYPGDEIDTVVVRSASDFPANESSARWIVPPRTSLESAEIQGAFDSMDQLPEGALRDFKLDDCGAVPSVSYLHPDRCHKPGANTGHCVDTLLEHRGFGWHEPAIPYYPDPVARSMIVALVDDPLGTTGYQRGKILWYSRHRWPEAPAVRLDVTRSESGPVVLRSGSHVVSETPEDAGEELHIALPPGEVTYLQLWSSKSEQPPPERLDIRPLRALLADAKLRTARGRLSRLFPPSLAAAYPDVSWPMLNPRKTIRLVHAVQKPLWAPRFGDDFAARRFIDSNGKTGTTTVGPTPWNRKATRAGAHRNAALLEGTVLASRKSSGRIDIRAERYDWIDDPTAKGGPCRVRILDDLPPVEPIDASVQQDSISLQIDDAGAERNIWHELKDTKHHHVAYHLKATSAFRNYFRGSSGQDGDSFSLTSEKDEPGGRRVHILSTLRPDVPTLDLILPSFTHESSYGRGWSRLQRRVGLKLWLARPWFSSGNGEKLAFICGPSNLLPSRSMQDAEQAEPRTNRWTQDDLDSSGPAAGLSQYISLIGVDPTVPGGPQSNVELVEALPPGLFLDRRRPDGRCQTDTNLVLAEDAATTNRPPLTVSAALFDVGIEDYDCDRRQYGVTVGIDLSSLAWLSENLTFRPFIRLALARYQPHSISGLELSRVVFADMTQLQPNRTLQVAYDPDRFDLIDVNVFEYGVGEWAMYESVSAPESAQYVVRIELLKRVGARERWVPIALSTPRIEKVGDGYLARARFTLDARGYGEQYAIRVHEHIRRRHGAPSRLINGVYVPDSDTFDGTDDIEQPVLHLLQPLGQQRLQESA